MVSLTFLGLDDLDSHQMLCGSTLCWDLLAVSLLIRPGLWVLGRKSTEVRCCFCIPPWEGCLLLTRLLTVGADLDLLAEEGRSACSTAKSLCFPLLTLSSWEESHSAQPVSKRGQFCSTSWGQDVYTNYLEFFCTGNLFLLPCLFIYSFIFLAYSCIYLYQNGLMYIDFLLWVIIQNC